MSLAPTERSERSRAAGARRLALVAALSGSLAACAALAGIDGLEIGQCKGGLCEEEGGLSERVPEDLDAGGDAFDEASLSELPNTPCPSGKGPVMVRVGSPTNNFCIDSTEVTVAQYRAFTLATDGGAATGGQAPECTWNTSYAAGLGGPDDYPIAAVDWCDAVAFCKWSGKRLCGKHVAGAFKGPVGNDDLGDFNTHEWLMACSNLGQNRYPYGSLQDPATCNVGENDAGQTVAVKSKAGCQGGFPGVYDLVGNLWEWYDGPCTAPDGGADAGDGGPAKQECLVKGGAFLTSGANIDCRVDGRGASRDRRGVEIGIRCCAD